MKQFETINETTVKIDGVIYKAEKPKFKVGDYVKWTGSRPTTGRIVSPCKTFPECWDIGIKGYDSCSESNLVLLTDKEIESYLKSEAERRGYKAGVRVRCLSGVSSDILSDFQNVNYYCDDDEFWMDDETGNTGVNIYKSGQWAEIPPQKNCLKQV